MERRYSVVLVGNLVITSFDQKGLVAGKGKTSREGTTTYIDCQRFE